ncbi:MAG: hypothetical protein ACP5GF_13155 [Thiomonas sp.]
MNACSSFLAAAWRLLVQALFVGGHSAQTPAALDGARYPSQGYAVWLYSAHSDLWR